MDSNHTPSISNKQLCTIIKILKKNRDKILSSGNAGFRFTYGEYSLTIHADMSAVTVTPEQALENMYNDKQPDYKIEYRCVFNNQYSSLNKPSTYIIRDTVLNQPIDETNVHTNKNIVKL